MEGSGKGEREREEREEEKKEKKEERERREREGGRREVQMTGEGKRWGRRKGKIRRRKRRRCG